MKVLHLAAGNRWTGAAAPAFAEVEALRAAGIDAHYAYVGGYKLEAKIGHHDFAHAIIDKAQNPLSFARSVAAIDRIVDRHGFDVIHAHLTYDHWLARMVARNHRLILARTFHARRPIRRDPLTRILLGRTQLVCVVNSAFRDAPAIASRNPLFTPPPLDERQFTAAGANVRAAYGILPDEKLVTVIGKLSAGRGFEDAISSFAALRNRGTNARMMIIGHGEHRPTLEAHARSAGVAPHVIWAGYHEEDLAEHYRAANLLFFTARGSDEGHRAVLEAMACGVVPAVYPIEGIDSLVGPASIARSASPGALGELAASLLAQDLAPLRRETIERSHDFGYEAAAQRLMTAYETVLSRGF